MKRINFEVCGIAHVIEAQSMGWGPVMGSSVVLMTMLGCYSTFDLPVQSVQALDRFQAGEHRTITSTRGESVAFDRDTILSFHDVELDRSREREARFTSILVSAYSFEGTTRSHERFTVDLRQVQSIHAMKPSAMKTTLAIVIPCVLVTALALIVFFPVCQATSCFGTL